MYEQVEKPKENKCRTVANSAAQKKSKGRQGIGLVDNRTEAVTQRKLQVNPKNMEQKMIPIQSKETHNGIQHDLKSNIKHIAERNIVQRKNAVNVIQLHLPGSYKEANADGYNPHGKTDSYNESVANYERLSASGFVSSWREKMIKHWGDKGWVTGKNIYGIRFIKEQKRGQWVDERGIQLDHAVTVANMREKLENINEKKALAAVYQNDAMKSYYHLEDENWDHVRWPKSEKLAKKKVAVNDTTVEPTVHGARKYYHDMNNIVPLTGTDNASKGDVDSAIFDWDTDFLANQREWNEMTGWVNMGVENKDIEEVDEAVSAMRETLDEYNGNWPII